MTERGLILKKGTIVDSTIISAPSSTKNASRKRDPEAHQTKKGNMYYFGFKAHIGVDDSGGLAHTVKVTLANRHDVTMTAELSRKIFSILKTECIYRQKVDTYKQAQKLND